MRPFQTPPELGLWPGELDFAIADLVIHVVFDINSSPRLPLLFDCVPFSSSVHFLGGDRDRVNPAYVKIVFPEI